MKKISRTYVSPGTGVICSEDQYFKEWDVIVKRLKEKYNLDVVSYDPNITAKDGDLKGDPRYDYSHAEIPLWLALKMCRNF